MTTQLVAEMVSWLAELRLRLFPPLTEEQANLIKRVKFPCC